MMSGRLIYRRAKSQLGRFLLAVAEVTENGAWRLIVCDGCGRSTYYGEPCLLHKGEA